MKIKQLKKSTVSCNRRFCSAKQRSFIDVNRACDAAACLYLEYDPSICCYSSDTPVLECWIKGAKYSHKPRFWGEVESSDSSLKFVLDVIPNPHSAKKTAEKPIYLRRHVAELHGFLYFVVLEKDLYREPIYANLQLLHRYDDYLTSLPSGDLLQNLPLAITDNMTVSDLLSSEPTLSLIRIYQLICKGYLCVDFERPLTSSSIIWRADYATNRMWRPSIIAG